jgi:hypothetical protein
MENKEQLSPVIEINKDVEKGGKSTDPENKAGEKKKKTTTAKSTVKAKPVVKKTTTKEKAEPKTKKTAVKSKEKAEVAEKKTTTKSKATAEPKEKKVVKKASKEVEVKADEKPAKAPKKVESKEIEVVEVEEDISQKYEGLTKEQLVDEIEALVQNEDINHIRKYIGAIKVTFRKLVKEENINSVEKNFDENHEDSEEKEETAVAEVIQDPLVIRFDNAFSIYKEKKNAFDQAFEKQKNDNLLEKENILEELRNLIESEEELKKTYDQFKNLQERWKQIGPVPQNAKSTLWNNFNFLVEKFFDKVKINKELKDLDLKKNFEAKTELCEKAEALFLEPSITKSFQQLQKLHEAWKETGPVQPDMKDILWERFKTASDQLNQRRQEFYDGLRDEQKKNYSAKLVLCEKAEQIIEILPDNVRDWKERTEQINELFKVWKTIGYAPKKVNNEVWVRFIAAIDSFFKSKKTFFKQFKDHLTENYNQKLNLCIQAEAIKDSEDWKQTTDQLIALQQEWKKVGPIPNKFSDKIWKRFREACDHFFNRKSEYFSNIGEKQSENLKQKLELIENVKNFVYTDDNAQNLKTLNEFQRTWMSIGHVPIKQKDKIQKEFKRVIDEQFEKLKISQRSQKTFSFKSKLENLKSNPNADNIIYKEKSFLVNKINGLQNDIKVWENNIGFFASSKKADVLKAEFEQKIKRAKEEIKVIEDKLKIIQKM